jgi:histidine triad (HIT) family protein
MTCIFCKIVEKEIPAQIVRETEELIAFNDLNPQAPHHILIIPKKHYTTLNDVPANQSAILGKLISAATDIATSLGIKEDGYRVVMNCNRDGGQSVYHIHLHLLGGRHMTWPPG